MAVYEKNRLLQGNTAAGAGFVALGSGCFQKLERQPSRNSSGYSVYKNTGGELSVCFCIFNDLKLRKE